MGIIDAWIWFQAACKDDESLKEKKSPGKIEKINNYKKKETVIFEVLLTSKTAPFFYGLMV